MRTRWRRKSLFICRWPVLSTILLLGIGCNQDRISRLEKENRDLAVRLDAASKAATFEAEAKCAQQARAEFNSEGWAKDDLAGFTNHYNARVNKCFMEVTSTKATKSNDYRLVPTVSRTVLDLDAFEGKTYAEYFWQNDRGLKYWEVQPFLCKVNDLSGKVVFCKTTEEYEALIRQFLE